MRLDRGRHLLIAVSAAALLVSACSIRQDEKHAGHVTVGQKGGTYQLRGLTIKAPAGAVDRQTRLTVSEVKATTNGPLNGIGTTKSVMVDISLDGKQPKRPLELTVSLKGEFLPQGANPTHAMLYSAIGKSFAPIPATVDSKNVLRASLLRLSDKFITFPDHGALFEHVLPSGVAKNRPIDCAKISSAGASFGNVKLAASGGWNDGRTSPVHPCLVYDGKELALRVINNSGPFWNVAGSAGTSVANHQDNVGDEMVKLLASKIFRQKATQAYLSRQSEIDIGLDVRSLPARVELVADPNTMFAEAGWVGLNVGLGLLTGSGSRTIEVARALMERADVVSCLQTAVQLTRDTTFSDAVQHFSEIFFSACGSTVAEGLGSATDGSGLGTQAMKRIIAVIHGALGGLKVAFSAIDSAFRQIGGPVKVTVERMSRCPSVDTFLKVGAAGYKSQYDSEDSYRLGIIGSIVCQGDWAAAHANLYNQGDSPITEGGAFLLRWSSGRWVYEGSGTSWYGAEVCREAPDKIKTKLSCE